MDHTIVISMRCGTNFVMNMKHWLSRDTPAKGSFPKASDWVDRECPLMKLAVKRVLLPRSDGFNPKILDRDLVVPACCEERICVSFVRMPPSAA